jgi:D-beta-D-heptose 7-phosphate kinase / D-beta-D-heptose 1-phosphate adenosyltransferase
VSQALINLVERFGDAHLWVIGDVMLDEYVTGTVGRISPEAPVPVVSVHERFTRLGGAANVARSIAGLGGTISLCGVVGADDHGDEVSSACGIWGIHTNALGQVPRRPTTHKMRVLGRGQQLLRLDWEQTTPVDQAVALELAGKLSDGPPPTAILLSDYAKGFLTPPLIEWAVEASLRYDVPILVDPKSFDARTYRGSTLIKPNLRELEMLTGETLRGADDETLAQAARTVLVGADIESMVVTLGSRGLLVIEAEEMAAVPCTPREVFDVTGAGDTVIAVLALGLSVGGDLTQAATLANVAAGIAVGEVGAAAVRPDRLIDVLRPREAARLVPRGAIEEQAASWRRAGKQVVFTNGCFDLFHAGHLALLHRCAELGDILVVGINSDASVSRLKGPKRPLVPEKERAALLGALDCVDAVVIFDEDTPLALLEQVRPHVLVKGQDYRIEDVVGGELVESFGGRVMLVPLLPEHSTTGLMERILQGRQ